jgi:hypothetical protein
MPFVGSAAASPDVPVCIVFSKDRAMQLDGLLRSMQRHTRGAIRVHVLYATSSEAHDACYRELMNEYADSAVEFIGGAEGARFRRAVMRVLRTSPARACLFLVDDIMFTEDVDVASFAELASAECVPSLRLGANLRIAYTSSAEQPLPHFLEGDGPEEHSAAPDDDALLRWKWADAELDWAYPLSVDGNIFDRRKLLGSLRLLPFTSPNSLEARLQRRLRSWRGTEGVCFAKSRIVNIPINRVQSEYENLHGVVHQDELATLWRTGNRIDVSRLDGFRNRSAHEEIDLPLAHPEADPEHGYDR